jgi:hypothetical protein
MEPALVLRLLLIVSQLSGYTVPSGPPPEVVLLTRVEMATLACSPHNASNIGPWGDGMLPHEECLTVIGRAYDDEERVYVEDDFEDSHFTARSIAVHELTHWMQWKHAWSGYDCTRARARESEAYRVQEQYIRKYEPGHQLPVMPEICTFTITTEP